MKLSLLTQIASLGILISTTAFGAAKPNLLLILSDDQSVPHLGCYGDPAAKTPNLDRFAGEGVRFNRMFTTAPQCVPSRASLLSGVSPVAARITRFSSPLPADVITLPELLRPAGYYTGVCRRGHHLDGPGLGPVTTALEKKHGLFTFDSRVDFVDRGSPRESTKQLVNQFIDQAKDQPWFLWVNFNDPHFPWDANPDLVDPTKIKVPPYLPDLPGVREDLAKYYAEVNRMDEEFQWVLDILKERGLAENTLVIFMGDNGYAFPRGKGSLTDPGLNVPCLVRWPGTIQPGVSDSLLSGEDITPTFLAAAGIETPKHMTGRSFLDLLRGKNYEPRKFIFAERGVHGKKSLTPEITTTTYDLARCVRTDRYKLIYNATPWIPYGPADVTESPSWQSIVEAHRNGALSPLIEQLYFQTPRSIYEFYDLQNDPWELNNLSGQPEVAEAEKELRQAMIEKMLIDFDYLPLPAE